TIKDFTAVDLLGVIGKYYGESRDWFRSQDADLDRLWPAGIGGWDGSVGYQGLMGTRYSPQTDSVHLAWMIKPAALQNTTGKLYIIDLGNEIPWHTCSRGGKWPECEGSTASTMK